MSRRPSGIPAFILTSLSPALLLLAGCAQREPEAQPPPATDEPAVTAPSAGIMPTLTPVPGTGTLAPSNADDFHFWVFGDNQGGDTSQAIFQKILGEMAAARPAFALSLGDVIEGEPDPSTDFSATITAEIHGYLQQVEQAGVPIFNAPGNHEMDDANDCPNATMHSLYTQHVGPLYGAFDYGNARFIALNTEDIPTDQTCSATDCPACVHCIPTSTPGSGDECSFVGQTQLDLLRADLAANGGKQHIFLFMHYPMEGKSEPSEDYPGYLIPYVSQELAAILDAHQSEHHNLSFILASHQHLYYNPQDPPNDATIPTFIAGQEPYYLVSGGAGAKIYCNGSGDFHHYLTFHVTGPEVAVEIRPVERPCAGS
jgi:hypothetical protein